MYVKRILSAVLCVMLVVCCLPKVDVSAKDINKKSVAMCNENTLHKTYLGATNDEAVKEYPNGVFMFPLSKAKIKMNNFYSFKVYREGGTKNKASVCVKTVDMTAKYGKDYNIYLDKKMDSKAVEGKANPYYNLNGYTFLPTITKTGTKIETNKYSADKLADMRKQDSEYSDYVLNNLMPTSSTFTLNFDKGENEKTIYIETLKKDEVTDNLDFTLNLCDAKNASVGAQTTSAITIEETRKKPVTNLSITDTKVNAESKQAYVVVKRTGNMGTFGTFTVRTKSDTATANKAYAPVQLKLDYTPGMQKIEVPVTMLNGAKNGTKFSMTLEDASNAKITDSSADVLITNSVKKEAVHTTDAQSSMVSTSTSKRGSVIVDASQFSVSSHTSRGTGKHSYGYDNKSGYTELWYKNSIAASNNGVSVKSNEQIDFTGVKNISLRLDNYVGSCCWDDTAVYVSDKDLMDNNTGNYDWMGSLSNDGNGGSWDMENVADSLITRTTSDLSQSKVAGMHYLYIALHKGACAGTAKEKLYNQQSEDVDNNILLNLEKYSLSIVQPDNIKLYNNGLLSNQPVSSGNFLLYDPGTTSDDKSAKQNVTIYRDETATMSGQPDSKYNNCMNFKGFVFVDPTDSTKVSSLYAHDNYEFTLTSDILQKYSNYIKDNKIIVKPVFEPDNANLLVTGFDNTSKTGQKFVVNNDNCSGDFYYNDTLVGTVSWTESERDGKKYYASDILNFTFKLADGQSDKLWSISYSVRSAKTQDLLAQAAENNMSNGTYNMNIQLNNDYVSVIPNFVRANTSPQLIVNNPDDGDFCGKGQSYYSVTSDGKGVVNGYTSDDKKSSIVFKDLDVSQVMILDATPKDGYRAKWQYTDATSRKTKTYYGKTFFFAVQNPYDADDNHVTLEFEKVDSSSVYDVFVNGTTKIQSGSVLNPPSSNSETYNIAKNVSVNIDGYYGMSDDNGEFNIVSNSDSQNQAPVKISVAKDEVHRVLATYNNQYFITDINMGDYEAISNNTSQNSDDKYININVNMPYSTYGVYPSSIRAYDNSGNSYDSTITLVSANAVHFDLNISTLGQTISKPVNMVRWTVESDDSIEYSEDVKLSENNQFCQWGQPLSEIVKAGEKLYVELFNVSYGTSAEEVYTGYGKFDTGYSFIASSVEDTVTYMPDIGVPTSLTEPVPVLGGVSPTFSIKGFTPIINAGSTGKYVDGKEIKTITIGVNLGKAKDEAAKSPAWADASPKTKCKQLVDVLNNADEAYNTTGSLPKFLNGGKVGNVLNMHTAVKLSVSATFAFQGNYYVDKDTAEWEFVSCYGVVGAGGSIRISIPFVLFYVPCFAYITASVNVDAYFGILPTSDETALTLEQLDDASLSKIQGEYEVKITLGIGAGIGYDGILSVSGNLTNTFDIKFNDFLKGKGTYKLTGGIMLELIFIKYSWSGDLANEPLFNTLDSASKSMKSSIDEFTQKDILKNVKIGDMKIKDAVPSSNVSAQKASVSSNSSNTVSKSTYSSVNPDMISLGNGKYFVATVDDDYSDTNKLNSNIIHYMIYDSNTGKITEDKSILRKFIEDAPSNLSKEELEQIDNSIYRIDSDVKMADCGDDILISWNKASSLFSKSTSSTDMLKSAGIATVYYNKSTKKFHDYKYIHSKDANIAYMSPKVAYNSNTKTAQVFYQSMDMSDVTDNTTLYDLQNHPTTLQTEFCKPYENTSWSDEQSIALNGKMLKYYDVTPYKNSVMISYVSSNTAGFTTDSMDSYQTDSEEFDTSQYGTENSMYIQTFDVNSNKLSFSNPICITSKDYVTANPQFVTIQKDKCNNTMIFYKCNGVYAYQNIDTLLSQAVYTDKTGAQKIDENYCEPTFISNEEEHEINDDFKVYYNKNGKIYALWTVTEGDCQQIWARSFVIDGIQTVEGDVVRDSDGNVVYESDGNPKINKYDTPAYLLKGYWGGKTYLTQNDSGSSEGKFKKDFSACVADDGNLVVAYDAYNNKYENNEVQAIDNQLVIGKFDTSEKYSMDDSLDDIQFSNSYPHSGDTIKATLTATNKGIATGRTVKVTLYVNGKAYSSKTVDTWLTSDTKSIDMDYTLPNNVEAKDVSMYFTISSNGNVLSKSAIYSLKTGSLLKIKTMQISPIKNISVNSDNAKYNVVAKVTNDGNVDYDGGKYIRLAEHDVTEEAKSMRNDYTGTNPVFTCYGSQKIDAIKAERSRYVTFDSDNIPKSAFEKYSGKCSIYLEGIIGDSTEWKTVKANDKVNIESEYYNGLTNMAQSDTADSITLKNAVVQEGKKLILNKTVTPVSALIDNNVTYTSDNNKIASVNKFGIVTAVSAGTTKIKAEINGKAAECTVTVTKADPSGRLLGDVNNDGVITLADATSIQKYLAQYLVFTSADLAVADVNSDGKCDIQDATIIMKFAAQMNIDYQIGKTI